MEARTRTLLRRCGWGELAIFAAVAAILSAVPVPLFAWSPGPSPWPAVWWYAYTLFAVPLIIYGAVLLPMFAVLLVASAIAGAAERIGGIVHSDR